MLDAVVGHDILMATMLNGAAVMDAALLLVAGNEPCPQPQTSEHLAAVEIMKLKNIFILQNKIDLVKPQEAAQQYENIQEFIRGTVAEGAPIIPISAQLKYNIDVICEYICSKIPVPVRDFTSSPQLIVIRSFDVNKPGAEARVLGHAAVQTELARQRRDLDELLGGDAKAVQQAAARLRDRAQKESALFFGAVS